MKNFFLALMVFGLCVACLATVANAQHDAGPAAVEATASTTSTDVSIGDIDPPPGTVPAKELTADELPSWFQKLVKHSRAGEWLIVTALVMLGLIYAARRWLFDRVAWFKTRRGGMVMAFGVTLVVEMAAGVVAGVPLSWGAVTAAFGAAAGAAGLWHARKPAEKADS